MTQKDFLKASIQRIDALIQTLENEKSLYQTLILTEDPHSDGSFVLPDVPDVFPDKEDTVTITAPMDPGLFGSMFGSIENVKEDEEDELQKPLDK